MNELPNITSHDTFESTQIQYNLTMTSVESNREPFHQCYQLSDEELGKGSFSIVYKGHQLPNYEKCEQCSSNDKVDEIRPKTSDDNIISKIADKEAVGRNNYMKVYRGISIHPNDTNTVEEVMSTNRPNTNDDPSDDSSDSTDKNESTRNNSINTTYAIKKISKEKLREEDVKSIYDEVAILQHLNHPHIIRLHDFFDEDQFYYLVMERVTGGELFDRIIERQYYNENEARKVCKILLDAVAYMHNQGIAHRDLKPENLLLVEKGNDSLIKIADFGMWTYCLVASC